MTNGSSGDAAVGRELELKMKEGIEYVRFTLLHKLVHYHQETLSDEFFAYGTWGAHGVTATSREAFIKQSIEYLKANPDVYLEVTSLSSEVSLISRPPSATTYATCNILGVRGVATEADSTTREAVVVYDWQLEQDRRWRISRHQTLRGGGVPVGF